jgi:uncharacterized protein with HEPN domain
VPPERWKDRLDDILNAISKIQRYTAGLSREAFTKDEKTIDAVLRNLSIIGEAAGHIPSDIQTRAPAVPWAKMRGMRHHIVHDYPHVDTVIVWTTITDDLPPVVRPLEDLRRG